MYSIIPYREYMEVGVHPRLLQVAVHAEREKGMLNKVSPMDLMDEYAKELMSEVPKKVRELDEKLGLNLFPK